MLERLASQLREVHVARATRDRRGLAVQLSHGSFGHLNARGALDSTETTETMLD